MKRVHAQNRNPNVDPQKYPEVRAISAWYRTRTRYLAQCFGEVWREREETSKQQRHYNNNGTVNNKTHLRDEPRLVRLGRFQPLL